jgi:hypothetical protein
VQKVTSPTDRGEESFDAASSQLYEGLRTCRNVLSNYRSLIAGEGDVEDAQAGFIESGEADKPSEN